VYDRADIIFVGVVGEPVGKFSHSLAAGKARYRVKGSLRRLEKLKKQWFDLRIRAFFRVILVGAARILRRQLVGKSSLEFLEVFLQL